MSELDKLQSYLRSLSLRAAEGEKLPTIRQLMQDFGLSQALVQRVFDALRAEGLIVSQVGRGTFFTGGRPSEGPQPERATGGGRSVILLRRPLQNLRGRLVLDRLQQALADHGDVTDRQVPASRAGSGRSDVSTDSHRVFRWRRQRLGPASVMPRGRGVHQAT